MNITKNEVDALNLLVNIEIAPENYQSKVDSVLLNYRKTAKIPGFRPGKVPMGLVKKQYGKEYDIRFVFSNSRAKLYKGAKSSYADWCKKNGFLYSDKEIPEEWLNE